MNLRIGLGHDIHPFAPEGSPRPLMLGGVAIPGARGLAGHSDADALLHSVCDAILGALGRGDLGRHFPDTDPAWKEVSSLVLLEKVAAMMRADGYRLVNLDTILIAQQPRLAPHMEAMRHTIAQVLQADPAAVNIKGKSPEGLGSLGRAEGIAAESIALLGAF